MSNNVKAFGMALDIIERKKSGKLAPMATCPACKEPLIGTIRFPKKEFICVACRRTWGFLDPYPVEATSELKARYEELKAIWDAEIAQQEIK